VIGQLATTSRVILETQLLIRRISVLASLRLFCFSSFVPSFYAYRIIQSTKAIVSSISSSHDASLVDLRWSCCQLCNSRSRRRRLDFPPKLYAASNTHKFCFRTKYPRHAHDIVELPFHYSPLHVERPAFEYSGWPTVP
jgi:hypothetical protein